MFSSREDPPRTLELVDPAQALQPRRVDEVLLCGPAGDPTGPTLRDAKVSVDGIAGQIDA